jgi:hypothetical protein
MSLPDTGIGDPALLCTSYTPSTCLYATLVLEIPLSFLLRTRQVRNSTRLDSEVLNTTTQRENRECDVREKLLLSGTSPEFL